MPRHAGRHDVCPTDTQYVVQLSGYTWALRQLAGPGRLRVLDAACGTGFGTAVLAQEAAWAVGVDVAPEAVAGARRRFRAPNLAYLVMDVERLAFRDGLFDAVVSQDTMEHVRDDERFVAEVARVLVPGGTFIVYTPFREVHTTSPETPSHLREYSPESLSSLLRVHFPSVHLFGRRPTPELRRLEGTLDEVRRYDPLRLRALVPSTVRHWLGSLWLRVRRVKGLREVSVEDVEYVEGPPPGSTTLIALCRARA